MELSLSGNSLKTLHRCVTCFARIGSELVVHGSNSQLAFHTLNSSRSAYQSITFRTDFFDSYSLLSSSSLEIRCSVLLKSVCSIFRTPVSSLSVLRILLPSPEASKLQWTLYCHNGTKLFFLSQFPLISRSSPAFSPGARKTYWISCNVEPEIQNLSLDRRTLQTSFVVRPRDLTRLLSNFQSSLQEITMIATDPSKVPSDAEEEIGGKAVEFRSYIDPAKENSDSTLHTQLWIDPVEEFLQYRHVGDPADVTFSLKELKVMSV
ncbi:cell cycle checkpoint control protein RAD9A [Dendrobium catenatum]|uniref:Cell cycle checkpoint control protein RAD9A n=1 Tax=Dendrobium catenatum TaxID=906689 RepID=A0A2I0VEC1_9ASPA|nr:cell cycle checkpoint control protein RAD9A [Dendrobium catenatum]